MEAKMLFTVSTAEILVGLLRKILGMEIIGNFPPYKKKHGKSKKAQRVTASYKGDWRKHHYIVPVIYTAVDTAPVFHKYGLERTVK
jgi:hypothetical protein